MADEAAPLSFWFLTVAPRTFMMDAPCSFRHTLFYLSFFLRSFFQLQSFYTRLLDGGIIFVVSSFLFFLSLSQRRLYVSCLLGLSNIVPDLELVSKDEPSTNKTKRSVRGWDAPSGARGFFRGHHLTNITFERHLENGCIHPVAACHRGADMRSGFSHSRSTNINRHCHKDTSMCGTFSAEAIFTRQTP